MEPAKTRIDEALTPVAVLGSVSKDDRVPQSPSAIGESEILETLRTASLDGPSEGTLPRAQMDGEVVSPEIVFS